MRAPLIFLNIVSFSFFYVADEGFGIPEALFFGIQGISYLVLFAIFIKDAFNHSPILTASSVFIYTIVLLIIVAAIHGVLVGNSLFGVFSEFTYYLPLFLMSLLFLSKHDKTDTKAALLALLVSGVIVSIYNIINYQQIILQATVAWRVEKARVANGEMLLVFNIIYLFTTSNFNNKGLTLKLLRYAILLMNLIALVVSQSRGYWLLCIGSLVGYIIFSELGVKFKLFLLGAFITPFLILFIYTFASELELVFSGLYERISSFTQLSRDTSLLERYIEYEQIKEKILDKFFTGHGFGSYYNRQYIVYGYSIPKLYIHNAYYSVLYKFGILGLIAFVGMHLSILFKLLSRHIFSKGNAFGTALVFMFILIFGLNLTSPQYYSSEAMLIFVFGLIFNRDEYKEKKFS